MHVGYATQVYKKFVEQFLVSFGVIEGIQVLCIKIKYVIYLN